MRLANPALRLFYAQFVTARGKAQDPRVVEAFAAMPRETFAGPGPWFIVTGAGYLRTPDDDPAVLYQDTLVALDAEKGINIGEPSLHARCLDALAVQAGDTVLHIGAGAGYYTAILAHLTGPGGQVHAYEIEPALAARATQNLADRPAVTVHARSGIGDGLPQADAIYVNAAVTQLSRDWLNALRPGGRLMVPLHATGGFGAMLCVTRPAQGAGWPARFVSPAGFIPCQGLQDGGETLTAAFADGDWRAVQSLRLDSTPDSTCWHAGAGWWLSTAPA